MIEAYRNSDGKTYDGVRLMADISGLGQDEILWTFNRFKALYAEGKSKEEARAIVKIEAQAKPWTESGKAE